MSGRGNILKIFNKSDGDDSGLSGVDNSTQEKLVTQLENTDISGGSGRARLFQFFKSPQVGSTLGAETVESNPPSSIISSKEISTEIVEKISPEYFNPENVYGKKGTEVNLACNYIGIKSDPNKGVYMYVVRFVPEVDSIHWRVKLLNEHRESLGGTKTFDGSVLFLPIRLEKDLTTLVSKREDNTEVEVRIHFKKKESLKNCLQLYNILFDRVMKQLNYVRFDRKQYDPTSPKIIPEAKLEVWPGYVTAVDEYDGGLMLCCDVSHRLLCQKSVLEMLVEIYQHNRSNFQDTARKALLGYIVITRYNNRTYKIDDIQFDASPLSTFETRTGPLSYMDYYRKHHNVNIKDTKQPLLISLKKTRVDDGTQTELSFNLVPELCFLTGLREELRKDRKLMLEIAKVTKVTPNQRMQALHKFYDNISKCPEARKILQDWGLSLVRNIKDLVGRKLDIEQIYFGKKSFAAGDKADFTKYATSNELLEVVHMKNWLLLYCEKDGKVIKSLLDNMERGCNSLGMRIQKPKIVSMDNDRVDTFVATLRKNIERDTQIVVCICPNARDDRYAAIKKICCSELPVASQVINARTLMNETKNRSIVQKIILQMNCKMGGALWSVKIPFKDVMVCGIDSFHDAGQKGNSVAAFVASLDATYTHWFSKHTIQTKKEEIVNGLAASFGLALKAYAKRNGQWPSSVIIYRDGVGDGQLSLCAKYEIPQFEAICEGRVRITFIVVQKRINTRYFVERGNNFENPAPGTIVDKIVTRKDMYDFFLVSQCVNQGTVNPTHFIVLRDDSNYGPDIVQKLSYKLCYLYYNWPGTVRVPAPCLYAHKLAFLIGQSVQREVPEQLLDKLYYL